MVACACEHCGHEFEAEPEGGHRLLCGDATDPLALDRVLDGEDAELCLTDPPYGIGEAYVLSARDLVLDPFCGSGTTLIAAEKTGRRCAAVELAPEYVDVSVNRWSKFTGRAVLLADDGRTFDEITQARGVAP